MTNVEKWQEELTQLLDSQTKGPRKRELAEKIQAAFQARYHLTPSGLAANFCKDHFLLTFKNKPRCFDHCTFYKTPLADGLAYVITSQPYTFEIEEPQKLALDHLALFFNCPEWSWWYPGKTNCFSIVFPRLTVTLMRRKTRPLLQALKAL